MNQANKRNVVLPYVLIAAGVLVLLANVGWLSFGGLIGALVSVAQLWPVALIAFGADLLTQGKHRAIVIAVALVVGAALLLSNGLGELFGGRAAGGGQTESVAMSLGNAQSAHIRLSSGVGEVEVRVAPGSSDAVAGTVRPAAGEVVRHSSNFRGGVLEVAIASSTRRPIGFSVGGRSGAWDLRLSDRVPVALDFDGGVGRSTLDLRGLSLTGLDIDAGVGAVTVTLPSSGDYDASIDAGVGEVIVRVPSGAPVRFTVSTGLGGVATSGDFERVDNSVYLSPAAQASGQAANVRVSGGVGTIRFESVR